MFKHVKEEVPIRTRQRFIQSKERASIEARTINVVLISEANLLWRSCLKNKNVVLEEERLFKNNIYEGVEWSKAVVAGSSDNSESFVDGIVPPPSPPKSSHTNLNPNEII